jgi:hypothetical protein
MYMKYIQGLFQSWLGTADFVLLRVVTLNSHYHRSLDTLTVEVEVEVSLRLISCSLVSVGCPL